MKTTLRRVLLAMLAAAGGGLVSLEAAEFRTADKGGNVVIRADETIDDDLYVFGRQITIDGTVNGDLMAFGEQITINGAVEGDLLAAGQTVVVGNAVDDARIAGHVLKLGPKAKLGGDLLAAGMSLECEPQSTVAGDVLYAGYQGLFGGQIDQDLKAAMAHCRLAGLIGGRADLEVGGTDGDPPPHQFGPPPPIPMPVLPSGLTIAETATVTGPLTYTAPQEAQIDPKATLQEVTHNRPAPADPKAAPRNRWVDLAWDRGRHAACAGIVGLLAILLFPAWTTIWADNIRTRPLASFVGGVVGLIGIAGILIVAIVAIVLVAVLLGIATLHELVPMVIVGGIVGYLALIVLVWLLGAFLAEVLAGLALGRSLLGDDGLFSRLGALLLGLVVVVLILSIPFVGPWIGFAVFLFALGGVCLWLIGWGPEEVPERFK